jgi:ABC-2 type transport system ATP-binding protein
MNVILRAQNLKKIYDDFIAVNNISFEIIKGEIFGFLGPNGAGKTTTINMLIGLSRISGGKVFYKDMDLTNHIKKAQEIIGIVADESNLYNEMSGFENLCFCGSLYGLSQKVREKRAIGLLELFRLKEAADKKFKAYSKGMKRKLTIAAALIHEPEILFLDEPTTGIDVTSVRHIRNLLETLNDSGTTIFLTTHYIEEAERLCDRVAFINKGQILQIDTVENLINYAKEANIVEIVFETLLFDRNLLLNKLRQKFPNTNCLIRDENIIKITSSGKIDIAPIVNYLSSENIFIYETRLIKPTLEDAFVKITGVEIDLMKKEKEKK